jgi:Protein of unknown function (DUF4231)
MGRVSCLGEESAKLADGIRMMDRPGHVFVILAAIPGWRPGQANAAADWAPVLAFSASACAAITPVLDRDMLEVGREAGWIRARATAEGKKSECYRLAARTGEYAGDDRIGLFGRGVTR